MAAAVAAAETTRVAANGGNCCFSPVPGGGWTRLRWLPPGRAARDGRAAILEERRPRLPATCAPIGRRAGRGRLVTVSMAPARAGAEAAGAGPHATWVLGGRRGRGSRGRQGRGRGSRRRDVHRARPPTPPRRAEGARDGASGRGDLKLQPPPPARAALLPETWAETCRPTSPALRIESSAGRATGCRCDPGRVVFFTPILAQLGLLPR